MRNRSTDRRGINGVGLRHSSRECILLWIASDMICSYLRTFLAFVVGGVGVLKVELRGWEMFLGVVVLAIKGVVVVLRFLWFLFDGLKETRIGVHLPQLVLNVILKLKLLVI